MPTSPDDHRHLERRIDALYAGPLAEFIATRKALATELRSAGDAEGAARVKALAKPTVAAWAINAAAHGAPELFERLVAAGEQVRRAQIDGLGPGALKDANRARRAAVAELLADVETALRDAGDKATRTTLDRAARNLEALAAYGRDQPTPTAGRLVSDVEPPGFEALAGVALAPPRRPAPEPEPEPEVPPPPPAAEPEVPPPPPAPDPAEVLAALERRRDELRTRADEADQALATARRTAESLAQQAARARERAGELETQARELRDAADRASAELDAACSR